MELGEQNPDLLEFQSLILASAICQEGTEQRERIAERNRDKEIHKRRLADLCPVPGNQGLNSSSGEKMIGAAGDPTSFEALHELIKAQTFRLANWRVASDDINYRRFFDTNDLAGICMENEAVFRATHGLILKFGGRRQGRWPARGSSRRIV